MPASAPRSSGRASSAEELLEQVRRKRPRHPRWLWWLAGIVGAACAIAFIVAITRDPSPTSGPPTQANPTHLGFGAGILVGLAAGIAIGRVSASTRRAADRRA